MLSSRGDDRQRCPLSETVVALLRGRDARENVADARSHGLTAATFTPMRSTPLIPGGSSRRRRAPVRGRMFNANRRHDGTRARVVGEPTQR